ncbi:hypothetical protein [Stappia indica]|uniref:hypothetical protein n=1 Tax=Stappia indica TaxID=538381 RepID=UPI001CD728A6|nr:hypothetical protein [Stappia indica]MCA1299356.1 hypothetical protein [Stappia indica]
MTDELTGHWADRIDRIEKNAETALVYRLLDATGRDLSGELRSAYRRDAVRQTIPAAPGTLKICAEGDSWINILWPFSAALGYDMTFFDVIEQRPDLYTRGIAWPGDTFAEILAARDYRQPLASGIYDFFIFSGGGNDILGGSALATLLKPKEAGGGSGDPRAYLIGGRLDAALSRLAEGYNTLAADVAALAPGTVLLLHGYDRPVPLAGEPWLGQPFAAKGYDLEADARLIAEIIAFLVDHFYALLDKVTKNHPNAEVMDLRGIVAGRWTDELHPRQDASTDIAQTFLERLLPLQG